MTKLEKLYQSIANFKELGLALNQEMLQKADNLEEELIKNEVIPRLTGSIEPIITQIQRPIVLVVDYVPGEPLSVRLTRKRVITDDNFTKEYPLTPKLIEPEKKSGKTITSAPKAVWTDKGFVTTSSSDRGKNFSRASTNDWSAYFYYNAIDPTYIVTPEGKHYLIHGSWHSGFALLQLDATTGKPINKLGEPYASSASELTTRYGVRIGTRTAGSRWQGSEAPEIIYKDGYYYLFMAYDGLDVPYNTRVVRSANIEGPYLDITGRNFTNGAGDSYPIVTHPYKFNLSNGWVGISHCAVFKKENTNEWFYMSQGRLPANTGGNPYSNAIMMGHVRRIVWCPASIYEPDNLWPIALPERYAAVPDYGTITKDSLVGTWEHINLKYSYAQQDLATALTLKADGTMSGALTGNWSFDATKKQLILGNIVVCVEREVDWEATPRRVTFVYAGTEKNLNATYWGKKSK